MHDMIFWSTLILGFVCVGIALFLLVVEVKTEEQIEKSEEEAKKVHEKDKEKREKRLELTEEEVKVYEYIKEKGEVLQSKLPEELNISKNKVSEILKSLENKGLIEKTKEGRSYKVRIKQE